MNIVLVTTENDPLGGVFAKAYRSAEGPPFSAIIVLPERKDRCYNTLEKVLVALKLTSIKGIIRLSLAKANFPIPSDSKLGLSLKWPRDIGDGNNNFLQWDSINDITVRANLANLRPDILVSIGAPVIIRDEVLAIPSLTTINVHNGRLPKYRGHFGTFWEIYNKEPMAYISIHQMVKEVDSGKLLAYDKIRVGDFSSFFDLLIEKKRRGGLLLSELLKGIVKQGEIPAENILPEFSISSSSYYGMPTVKDIMRLKWEQ